eukprot:scaffold299_cov343-Prasinococcus_capsulatus_cf.AAC.14
MLHRAAATAADAAGAHTCQSSRLPAMPHANWKGVEEPSRGRSRCATASKVACSFAIISWDASSCPALAYASAATLWMPGRPIRKPMRLGSATVCFNAPSEYATALQQQAKRTGSAGSPSFSCKRRKSSARPLAPTHTSEAADGATLVPCAEQAQGYRAAVHLKVRGVGLLEPWHDVVQRLLHERLYVHRELQLGQRLGGVRAGVVVVRPAAVASRRVALPPMAHGDAERQRSKSRAQVANECLVITRDDSSSARADKLPDDGILLQFCRNRRSGSSARLLLLHACLRNRSKTATLWRLLELFKAGAAREHSPSSRIYRG